MASDAFSSMLAAARKGNMFWRVPSYSQASPLEGILDKQQFTLEELLDEDDLIQVVCILAVYA